MGFTVVVMVVVFTCRKCRFVPYLLWHRLAGFASKHASDQGETYHDRKRIVCHEDLESAKEEQMPNVDLYSKPVKPEHQLNIYVIQNQKILESLPPNSNSSCINLSL